MTTKTTFLTVALIVTLAVFTFVAAETIISYWYPNTGTIQPTLEIYLDHTLYLNGTEIDWGICYPNTENFFENLTVINKYTETLTVSLETKGLPSGWNLIWTATNLTLNSDEQTEGKLILSIPANATDWPKWGFWINGN